MKFCFNDKQQFQIDAARAVLDVFSGQPYATASQMQAPGDGQAYFEFYSGWRNAPISLTDDILLKNLRAVQLRNGLKPAERLEEPPEKDKADRNYNLTIEMETGVGKTYTYIKTMYELNKAYGWSKFIIIVPSIAIREGVLKTFQITEDHFGTLYGRKIRYFIYNSGNVKQLEQFARENTINAMIINTQAFNSKKDRLRIHREMDSFNSRKPIEIIASARPILIIDEPQSAEGAGTVERLREFKPLFTLRYSATHRPERIFNMVYRLDAQDAYNLRLVKKIVVKGITSDKVISPDAFIGLNEIQTFKDKSPKAVITFDHRGANKIARVTRVVDQGYDLYVQSGKLEKYRDRYKVAEIDGRDNSITFVNGLKIFTGQTAGDLNVEQVRRIQIRETIRSHIERERQLFKRGIKVLSLFFIDEVAKYRLYEDGSKSNGVYARIFEEEYKGIIAELELDPGEEDYKKYLDAIPVDKTHEGYFSIDKHGRMVDGPINKEKKSDDVDAYDLIMRNKELLLDLDPAKSPVRFIFSHSALREGWDNPNVFQICTLKAADSEIRKRQEVGRGLRLCVNQKGERMDESKLRGDVRNVNQLTVIANESYEEFTKKLQGEIAAAITSRPTAVTTRLFENKTVLSNSGEKVTIDQRTATAIYQGLIRNDYVDVDNRLTDKFYEDKKNGKLILPEMAEDIAGGVLDILDNVYNPGAIEIENGLEEVVEQKVDTHKLARREFLELWSRINSKSFYKVEFDPDELIKDAIKALDQNLRIVNGYFEVREGTMEQIESKQALENGAAFQENKSAARREAAQSVQSNVKYDLLGRIVAGTGLSRRDSAAILKGIKPEVFEMFKVDPEEFILKACKLINEVKATVIINAITYNKLEARYDTDIFTRPGLKGKLGVNAMKTEKHLYDHLVYQSEVEKTFAEHLEQKQNDVTIYVKLPPGFYINTPVGNYNPDWAIAFKEGSVKHIYFVAETKGSMSTMQLRKIEETKIECARKHFEAISNGDVHYDIVKNYDDLLALVQK